jgi:IS30 family transposase
MGKGSYKHIGIEQRRAIESGLNAQKPLSEIGREIGFDVSTVRREILRNRRDDGLTRSRNRDKNDCARLRSCSVRSLCGNGCDRRLCRCCELPCQAMGCPQYAPRTCRTVDRAPFVCNACARYNACTLQRFRYSAESADAASRRRARESRDGVDLTGDEMELLVDTVRGGIAKGQSIHHVFETNDLPCSERSFYRHVENESVPILSIELAKKVRYKKRRRKAQGHEPGFYRGHEHDDFMELPEGERACVTEVDTVLGSRRDTRCILSLHRVDLHFQVYLLLQSKTRAEVVRALDWLEECCTDPGTGENCFHELFGLMLPDRGSEFDDIAGMERSALAEGSRRASCYFADPSRPDQKGACEKNHVELRKVIPKGTSLDDMDAATLADVCSHVNSSVRRGCGNASPFMLARLVFPQYLFDSLGLRPIPPDEVIGAPGILYRPEGRPGRR